MDAGFYRGTNQEQDIRFTDKERKLLKQMKFEDVLEQKVDLQKVNVDVLKPWITLKLNEILGMEDDVVVEYVFTQLEEKELNPKKMQINLTGFLNARRAREFMGELWQMFVEAQNSPEGIPSSLVERKVQELKISNAGKQSERHSYAKATEIDWAHRYKSLTGGRWGKLEPDRYQQVKVEHGGREDGGGAEDDRRKRDPDDDRDERAERRMRHEEQRFKERKDLLREKKRHEERETRRHDRRRSSSSASPAPPVRRFTEGERGPSGSSSRHEREERRAAEEKRKGKKERKRHHSRGEEGNGEEKRAKKAKKQHKSKEKKSRKDRDN